MEYSDAKIIALQNATRILFFDKILNKDLSKYIDYNNVEIQHFLPTEWEQYSNLLISDFELNGEKLFEQTKKFLKKENVTPYYNITAVVCAIIEYQNFDKINDNAKFVTMQDFNLKAFVISSWLHILGQKFPYINIDANFFNALVYNILGNIEKKDNHFI